MQPGFGPVWDRIKSLEAWEVRVELPEDFHLEGIIPYEIHIENNVASIKLVAVSSEEAVEKAIIWIDSCRRN